MTAEAKAKKQSVFWPEEQEKAKALMDERKAFTVARVPGGWSFVELTYASDGKDDVIVGKVVTQPDIKAVAVEKFKIAAARYWTAEEAKGI